MYTLLRPLLFRLDAEKAHALSLKLLDYLPRWCFATPPARPVHAMGLPFPHPVGLAAGLDKNGEHLDALARMGFSFIEIGTVTPRPQPGNPRPRLFRLPESRAFINRLGFNNLGVDALVENVKRSNYQGILGINIGKNRDTSLSNAVDDYLECFRKVYPLSSYVTVNISSPNTPGLRELQQADFFDALLDALREEQLILSDAHKRWVPLAVKISPDESDESLTRMANSVAERGIEAIIATNTTALRVGVRREAHADETGGLSGHPLAARSTECVRVLKRAVGDAVTLIGVGGIDSPRTCRDKLRAGASLVQVYSGLVYQGPGLVHRLVASLPESG